MVTFVMKAKPGLTREVNGLVVPIAGSYTLDVEKSVVKASVRHMMLTTVKGYLKLLPTEVHIAEQIEDSWVQVQVDVSTLNTKDSIRDNYLRSSEFLDVESYPTFEFKSTALGPKLPGWMLQGDLSIKDLTKSVVFEVDFYKVTVENDVGAGDVAGADTVGRLFFSAWTELDREEWGLTWSRAIEAGGVVVSKKIRVDMEIQAVAVRKTKR